MKQIRKRHFLFWACLPKHRPDLVRKIYAAGHEIGLHGRYHINMRKLSREQAYQDINDAKKLVTDIIGAPVYGYRAPYFSIDETNLYVLEILAELGLMYDSSIFPVKLKRYGMTGFNKNDALYKLPNGKEIVELPLTVAPFQWKRYSHCRRRLYAGFPEIFSEQDVQENERQSSECYALHAPL